MCIPFDSATFLGIYLCEMVCIQLVITAMFISSAGWETV